MKIKDLIKENQSTAIVALVFTDIINSTTTARGLGHSAWLDRLKKHFARVRHYLASYNGYEVKLVGDGCMVAFPTADKALLFALALLKDTGHPSISIRAGIHVGTVQVVENDIYGLTVNHTSRVLQAMNRSGIALSGAARAELENQLGKTVPDLGTLWVLHHEQLKGFEQERRLCEIITPETGALPQVISRFAPIERSRGLGESDNPTPDQHSQNSTHQTTLSQRLYGSLEFDGGPPNDEEVKEIIADHLLKKYS